MMTIARVRIVARIAAAALLFAHAAVAFADCSMPTRSPAAAIASGSSPCHESGRQANLCVMHCLSGDQSLDKPQASVPQPPATPVLVLQQPGEVQYVQAPALRQLVPPSAAPPPRILFRTLRI
jgi:hypothetical protein